MLPNLIHKVRITVEPLNHAATTFDPEMREEIGGMSFGPAFTIFAQPEYRKAMQARTGADIQTVSPGGTNLEEYGYMVIRKRDADKRGWTPQPGDRIAKMGHRNVDLYIIAFQPMGHYADQNGASLYKVYLQDKTPGSTIKGPRNG